MRPRTIEEDQALEAFKKGRHHFQIPERPVGLLDLGLAVGFYTAQDVINGTLKHECVMVLFN